MLIYGVVLVFKIFTANKFDKLFLPKHQKYIYDVLTFVMLYVIFNLYAGFFSFLFERYTYLKHAIVFIIVMVLFIVLLVVYLIIWTIKVCVKLIKNKKFSISHKFSNGLLFISFFLAIYIFSYSLNQILFLSPDNWDEKVSKILSQSITFFIVLYASIKANIYFVGYNKRDWQYVIAPTPEDIVNRHLYVRYSLSRNILVLSDSPKEEQFPNTVYLFDLQKESYICFKRVLNFD